VDRPGITVLRQLHTLPACCTTAFGLPKCGTGYPGPPTAKNHQDPLLAECPAPAPPGYARPLASVWTSARFYRPKTVNRPLAAT
jgi:hypothetical protein